MSHFFFFFFYKTQVILFNAGGTDIKTLPKLTLNGKQLEYTKQATFLGMIFDNKLTWKPHIDTLITKCRKDLNTLRLITGSTFGADKKTIIMLYKALILSKIDYGCQAYASASKTLLKKLDTIQATALRIATGAYKGTSNTSLQVECNVTPLNLRRDEFTLKYWARSTPLGNKLPINELVTDKSIYTTKRQILKDRLPYNIKVQDLLLKHNLTDIQIQSQTFHNLANIKSTTCKTGLTNKINKQNKNTHSNKLIADKYIHRNYANHLQIYTDGSKDINNKQVGCAFTIPSIRHTQTYKLNEHLSIYTAELIAIQQALNWIIDNKPPKAAIITDSLSALTSIKTGHSNTRKDITDHLQILISQALNEGINLILDWCPSHCNITGNELADKAAKQALTTGKPINILPSTKEIYAIIKAKIRQEWADDWKKHTGLRHTLDPTLSTKLTQYSDNRLLDRIHTRLRMGVNGLKGNNLFYNGADPLCNFCGGIEDTSHYLLQCTHHSVYRNKLKTEIRKHTDKYITINLLLEPPNALKDAISSALFQYIQDTGYHKII